MLPVKFLVFLIVKWTPITATLWLNIYNNKTKLLLLKCTCEYFEILWFQFLYITLNLTKSINQSLLNTATFFNLDKRVFLYPRYYREFRKVEMCRMSRPLCTSIESVIRPMYTEIIIIRSFCVLAYDGK